MYFNPMGIRVRKLIGYGVHGFQPNDAFRDACDQELTLGDFAEWCHPRLEEILAFAPGPEDRFRRTMAKIELDGLKVDRKLDLTLNSHCEFDDEFGISDLLVFIPPGMSDRWSRYNNTLDWSEETQLHNQEKRVVWLDHGAGHYEQGKPPLLVAAMAMLYGVPEVWPRLKECLYVYWA